MLWKIYLINAYLIGAVWLLTLLYLAALPFLFHVKRQPGWIRVIAAKISRRFRPASSPCQPSPLGSQPVAPRIAARRPAPMPTRVGNPSDDPTDYAFLGPKRYLWLGWRQTLRAVALILLAVALTGTSIGLAINRPMRYVFTVGDLVDFAFPPQEEPITVTDLVHLTKPAPPHGLINPNTDPGPHAEQKAVELRSQLKELSERWYELRITGEASGETNVILFWVPPGYSPDDGKTYNVMEFIHGYPGSPYGVANALDFNGTLVKAQTDGTIPPTIAVVPEGNLGSGAPVCADVEGRAQTATWLSVDVPRITRTLFPNVTDKRDGWLLAGNSSGGYCAARLGILYGDTFGEMAVLSGYNTPELGAWSDPRHPTFHENTLSSLLDRERPWPARLYVYGASMDTASAQLVRALSESKKRIGDAIKFNVTARGGHNWDTWRIEMPNLYRWWGEDLRAQDNEGAASAPPRVEGELLNAQDAPFFSLMGWGNIGLFILLALAALAYTVGRVPALIKPLRYPLPAALPSRRAKWGAWARCVGWQTLTWLLLVFSLALLFNRSEQFFTSYDEVYEALSGLLNHVIVKLTTGQIVA